MTTPDDGPKRSAEKRALVGPAGWSYADWEGIVYPPGAPTKGFDRLAWVARYFDCIEVNSSFYRIPAPGVTSRWAGVVADRPGFLFAVKAFQGFTHHLERPVSEADVSSFRHAVEPLASARRLGAILLQFPFFFSNTDQGRERLRTLAKALGGDGAPLVVEVRHNSWTGGPGLGFLHDVGLSIANIDQPLASTSVRPGVLLTGSTAYVRLHGRNATAWFSKEAGRDEKYDYLYTENELDEWVSRILDLRDRAERTFVVANNHFRGQAVTNALELRARLEARSVEVPEPLLARYPRLDKIAKR